MRKQPEAMPTITLNGCTPVPLAHYLKALGILRLVSESDHGDATATAHWAGNQFMLTSRFDSEREPFLVEFFLRNYRPTPIAVPGISSP